MRGRLRVGGLALGKKFPFHAESFRRRDDQELVHAGPSRSAIFRERLSMKPAGAAEMWQRGSHASSLLRTSPGATLACK